MVKFLPSFLVFFLSLSVLDSSSATENIDPQSDGSRYAYSENSGWLNGEPLGNGGPGIEVQKGLLTGYVWGENIGWIRFNSTANPAYRMVTSWKNAFPWQIFMLALSSPNKVASGAL